MNGLTGAFLAAISAETATRLWLSFRQSTAVRAHRDRVPAAFQGQITPEDQLKAADYTLARVHLGRWATLWEFLIKIGFTVGGGLAALDVWIPQWPRAGALHGCVAILTVFLMLQALGLPFSLWRTFRIEARFGFNRTSPRLYAADLSKRLLLALVLLAPLVFVTLLLMDMGGAWWWVWAWLVYVASTVTLTWAAPRFIAPLFNRFTAITDAGLRERVEALLRRCGYSAGGGVFVMDGSRRSAHGNAYFTGIGRNKRIVFFDTLLARIDLPEIEAVLAHELGHFRLHHVRQRLGVSLVSVLAALALLAWLARTPAFFSAFGTVPSAATALLLFALTAPSFAFFATPVESWWARRQELAADEFAAKYSSAGDLVPA